MKVGVSSYSFSRSFAAGTLDILGAIDWIAGSAASHLEISLAGLGQGLIDQPELVAAIKQRAAEKNVPLENYVVGANFRDADLDGQIATLKQHIDIAHELGITNFRHDVVEWGWRAADQAEFEEAFATVLPATQEIADYAAPLGITTSIENHGFAFNNSERINRLVHAVNRPNFGLTVDIGNFLCVDELPESAVGKTLANATVLHLKDFYVRTEVPGGNWLKTVAGNYIRGSIVGFGDLPMRRILSLVKNAGFDGPISIEFEGLEEPSLAVETGLANALRIWEEI